ncbi:MAG TPA: class I SAM-dependent methyltransferase [Phycisphaerae bacterium]|nr:class I SAM-dependent methyltransferase [Phycisphaerae bacterium]
MDRAELDLMRRTQDVHWWYQGRKRIVERMLARYVPVRADRSVADVGSGFGVHLSLLMGFGRVTCVEADPEAREALLRRWGDRVRVLDAKIPDPIGERFDLILMTDVLEHVEDDAGAVDWLREHLSDGGLALLTVPAHPCLWTQMDEAVGHYRRYRRRTLVKLLREGGLEIVRSTYYNALLLPAKLAFVLFDRLQRRRRPGAPKRSYNDLPPRPVNWLFRQVLSAEAVWLGRFGLPAGVGLIVLARRRGGG